MEGSRTGKAAEADLMILIAKNPPIEGEDEDYKIDTPIVKAKTFAGAERKFKGKDVVGMIRVDEDEFMVFVYEE